MRPTAPDVGTWVGPYYSLACPGWIPCVLVNAGVAERVAMTITGHRTRSVFDRYHIVSPGDLQAATRRLMGIVTGTIDRASPNPAR